MSKKKRVTKLEIAIWEEQREKIKKEEEALNDMVNQLYENGAIIMFGFPGIWNLDVCSARRFMNGSSCELSKEEKIYEQKSNVQRFAEIRQNIQEKRTGNVEIRFDAENVQCAEGVFSLGNMIAKIRMEGFDDADYIFLREGDKWDAQIFIRGAPKEAYLVLKNDSDTEYIEDDDCFEVIECAEDDKYTESSTEYEGNSEIIKLKDFYLMGVCYNPKTKDDVGIIVEYSRSMLDVFCGLIQGIRYNYMKEHWLCSDWIEREWTKRQEEVDKYMEEMEERRKKIFH